MNHFSKPCDDTSPQSSSNNRLENVKFPIITERAKVREGEENPNRQVFFDGSFFKKTVSL